MTAYNDDIIIIGGDPEDDDMGFVDRKTDEIEPEPEAAAEPEENEALSEEPIVIGGDSASQDEEEPAQEQKTTEEKPEQEEKAAEAAEDEKPEEPQTAKPVITPKPEPKPAVSLGSTPAHEAEHLLVTCSPHLHSGETTRVIMQDVCIALMPTAVVASIYYGWRALMLIAVCIVSCVLTEYISRIVMKRRQTISDFSAVVTGMILAFCLPPNLNPIYAVIGSVVAIAVVKQMFGGIGMNFANPALTARIVLFLSFTTPMCTFSRPFAYLGSGADAVTSATPLVEGGMSYLELLLGNYPGCLGETCAISLLLGGAYLLIRRIITWEIPVFYLGTVALLSLMLGIDPIEQLLAGGLMLGALFMATDYTTSPVHKYGKMIFGFGCGLLTVLIRQFASIPEGVSFAILIMNILVPHIDRLTLPKPFGEERGAQ